MHFDLRVPGGLAGEAARLKALGAIAVSSGENLTIMRDSDGNEFCIQ